MLFRYPDGQQQEHTVIVAQEIHPRQAALIDVAQGINSVGLNVVAGVFPWNRRAVL